ncbi:hypothetical protein CsatB_019333 [Cannabis sativa]|uniref:TF-B3 domain-containing protein n=1 Tax=Cannabis sativa TaxID=3483 RepID=A0A7J6HPX1_CANSA|nr:B3 domain-containing protein At2g36080 [Cannabis sativa]KAF4396921.1 hypothetical protein F8388_004889 [Cannabis sativa]
MDTSPHNIREFYHQTTPFTEIMSRTSNSFNLNQYDDNEHNDVVLDQRYRHPNQNDNNNNEEEEEIIIMKEPMFEKPLTPSDVGKLNRLVIPKQHAEKYFPLGGGDSVGGEKGLLLSFEDESGKFWRFRYSYWNSSQSYVLTKGWSRYVKEKRLDAGDVVLFERHCTDNDRLFIGWRRRQAAAQDSAAALAAAHASNCGGGGDGYINNINNNNNNNTGWTRMFYSAHPYPTHPHYQHHHQLQHHPVMPYHPDSIHAGISSNVPNQTTSSPVHGNSKILRLFGVNLECHEQQSDENELEPSTPDGSSLSSQGPPAHHQFYPPAHYSDHMDFTFSRDVKPMRNDRG